ncbi:hypothetical protein DRN62_00765 [Nanoarchaeota archaeon]|nr:MAG: hypothetical protein DRN62_00765 [Nanoarchaeota archaeon]
MSLRRDLRKIYLFELFRNLHLVSAVLIPFFTDWGGLNLTQTMWLQSWFIAWIFLLEIPTGSIADVLGRKISLSIGALVGSIAALVYSSYPNFSLFMLGELLYALSYSLFSGADKAMIYDTLKMHGKEKESKKIFGKAFTFKMIGMLIGAPLGSLIAGYLGVRYAMMFMFFPLFTSFLIGLSLKEPERGERAKSYFQVFKEGMNVIRSDKELLALICNYVAFYVIAYYTIWMYQPLLLEAGMNISLLGFVHSALIIAQMILANSYAFLEDLLGRKKLIMLNPIVLGLSFVFCGISNGLIPLLLLVILSAGFGKSRDPLMQSYLNEFIPSKQRATVLSTISMLSRLILAFTNLLIGMLMDVSVKYAYLILGFITLFLSFALRVDAREKAY